MFVIALPAQRCPRPCIYISIHHVHAASVSPKVDPLSSVINLGIRISLNKCVLERISLWCRITPARTFEVRNDDVLATRDDRAGKALSGADGDLPDAARAEAPLRRERQFLVFGVIEQDRGRVGTELVHQQFDECIQRQA